MVSQKKLEGPTVSEDGAELQFAGLISHELRTPLYIIREAMTAVISDQSVTSQEKGKLLSLVDRNTDRLINLVEKLLLFVRLGQPQTDASSAGGKGDVINVREMVHSTIQSLETPGKEPLSAVEVSIAKDVPERLQVCGDSLLVEQALANLLANAFQYGHSASASKCPAVTLIVHTASRGSSVVFEVVDHGEGIPYEEQEPLFRVFYRGQSGRMKRPGGLGLGLSLTRLMIESLKGKIGFRSTPGDGSTFWFSLDTGK